MFSIKYTIKIEFSFLKINILFSLEILNQVDKGPPFVSTTLRKEASKSNFFRDISTKLHVLYCL